MHEFSLATEVIRIAKVEADKAGAVCIKEISVEVGNLSGVEADAFESAMGLLAADSVLSGSAIRILKTRGKGLCNTCKTEFDMISKITTCPQCHAFPSVVKGGDEFRVLSIVIE
jgi:hydrogenase nickel incorporation protein HypA/HybF